LDTVSGSAPGRNTFLGNVSGNTISFQGIPILPPVTTGVQRVYRITNVRINATGAGSTVVSGLQPIYAYISTNGSATLPVSNSAVTVAFVSASMTPTVTESGNKFPQCNPLALGQVALLNFAENFPSAFKTRVFPVGTSTYQFTGTSSTVGVLQNQPGQLYTSESGLIFPAPTGFGFTAGLADSGTRFKAVFNNLPSGATIYVSKTNVDTSYAAVAAPGSISGSPTVPGGFVAPQTAYAEYTTNGEAGLFKTTSSATPALSITANSATAVWEVLNTNTSSNETFTFAVWIGYTPNLTANTPTLMNKGATVTLTYAPISTVTGASNSAWIPRFIAGAASTAQPIVTIVPCQTILLFPYVTTLGGFDTGIAISNTSMDPLTPATQTSHGTCTFNFYGEGAPTAPFVTSDIAAGTPDHTKAAFQASTLAPNFQGYMFAVCNFQYAHGFAFVSDVGARNLAMGYLALIVNDKDTGVLYLGRPGAVAGESLMH